MVSQEHRGHQSSGAPTFFFGVFLMVFSHLCWQCSDKTRKCPEHINTLGKKEKLIFLKPILEIKTKNLFSTWKGTRVLLPFQVENRFFVLISRMGFRYINFSFYINVRTPSRKPRKKMWGHQSSGAQTPELWCPLCSWLMVTAFAILAMFQFKWAIMKEGLWNIAVCV